MVERLFLAVPRGCLQFVIVVFPDHTHLLFLVRSVCLFYIFLLLFSNKTKSSFLFYGDTKQFFTTTLINIE